MRALGVDPGERRIGLAVSDEDGVLAMPLKTLERAGDVSGAAEAVAREARDASVERIVVGLPVKLDGTEGPAARRARALGRAIARHAEAPMTFWDERLTTAQAERALSEIDVRGAHRRRVVDQSAAALLLQSYLDAHARSAGPGEEAEEHDVPVASDATKGSRAGTGSR